MFEAQPQAGGMLREMVPEFKLPRKVLDDEIEKLKKVNIEITTGTKVESLDKLLGDGYDAVFVGVGAQKAAKLGIEGESDSRVIDGRSFLRQVNAGQKIEVGANVAVIGSGYGAATAARVALRLGAKSATIISADSKMTIPGDELAETLAEGVEIKSSASCVKIAATGSKLRLECGPAGVQKARINGSGFAIDVDTVIAAGGGTADLPDQFGLGLGDRESIQVNPEDLSTGREGIFAGGDAVTHASFIEAVAAGRKAAISIDRFLGGSGDIEETLAPVNEGIPRIGRISSFAKRERGEMPCASPPERKTNFAQVEQGFSDDAGQQESLRCMGCDLRFIVGRMVAQP